MQEEILSSKISIRKFTIDDIPNKIKWINDPEINRYLHYDLPLEEEKTLQWFLGIKDRDDRFDGIIEFNEIPVGLIGLLKINKEEREAEYYITLGDKRCAGRGVATIASEKILSYAFRNLDLNRVYLSTEKENAHGNRLYERLGFTKYEPKNPNPNLYYYEIKKKLMIANTPIIFLDEINNNKIYVKREDLIPFSFGGNKARKATFFFKEIDEGAYNHVVTYGTSSSNHCRIVANEASRRKIPCTIIGPEEVSGETFNSKLMKTLGAEIITVPIEDVHSTIENTLSELTSQGKKPYFIEGGGHGNLGTQAYVECYKEILDFEKESGIEFDYIFFASGTGTTQAGLVCGQILADESKKIIGISIARKNPRGRDIIINSEKQYLSQFIDIESVSKRIEEETIFVDDYTGKGYGKTEEAIDELITDVFISYGLPLDNTYTGKAFYGMKKYIDKKDISEKNILFIHTGGTPLYFDRL